MLCKNDGRAISAILNAVLEVGNSRLHDGLPAGNSDRHASDLQRTRLRYFLKVCRVSSRKFWRKRRKNGSREPLTADQVIAEWLNWLCDNGSVFGRC